MVNIEAGYNEIVCISCSNLAEQEITFDGISMEQVKKPDPVVVPLVAVVPTEPVVEET